MEGVLTTQEMEREYGSFFHRGSRMSLDRTGVPRNLWPLLPYAAFWGVSDDWAREDLVRDWPPAARQNLKAVIALFEDELDHWLAGPEADNPVPSPEYLAFSAMRMAADFA